MAVTPGDILDAAAAQLAGQVVRTMASVIGKRAGESVIVATTSYSYTVTVLVSGLGVGFTVTPRGWLKKTLAVAGEPADLVAQVLEPTLFRRLVALTPLHLELGRSGLRLEVRYGAEVDLAETLDLTASLAQRARLVASAGTRERAASVG